MTIEIAEILRSSGINGLSIRAVAERLGLAPSNLHYRFGSQKLMLRQGVEQVADSYNNQLDRVQTELARNDLDCSAVANLLRFFVHGGDEWLRSSALVLLELALMNSTSRSLGTFYRAWVSRLEEFWHSVARSAGRNDEFGDFLTDLHLGLMLHFSGSSDRFERSMACNEIIDRILLKDSSQHSWFKIALSRSLQEIPEGVDMRKKMSDPVHKLLEEAIKILASTGPDKLTYRSLANKAGVSHSAVAHHFPNRKVLLFSAYRLMHRQLITYAADVSGPHLRLDPKTAQQIAAYPEGNPQSHFACYSAFELFAERNPEFEGLAHFFRMTHGLYHLRKHDPAFDIFGDEAFSSFAYSFPLIGSTLRKYTDNI